jgi:hypothetical protein
MISTSTKLDIINDILLTLFDNEDVVCMRDVVISLLRLGIELLEKRGAGDAADEHLLKALHEFLDVIDPDKVVS